MPSSRAGTHFRLWLLPLCALSSPWAGNAASPPDSSTNVLELPVAQITGRTGATANAGAYRMDAEELRRFATLEEALEALPGFRVRRQGGLGGYSELSFRGARASQVDIYVDGIRLNQDGDASPDLSKWPLLWFTSLEARTGFDAQGGGALARIDLSTRDEGRANIQARAGSFSSAEAAASAQVPVGAGWKLGVGAQGQSARNDYPYYDNNQTQYFAEDDRIARMDNNGYWSRGARAALRRETGASRHSVSVLWLESRKEYPGIFPADARAYARRGDWLGAWRLERFDGPLPWETGLQARRFEDFYRDPGQSLGYLSYEAARVSTSAEADARARARILPGLGARADLRLRAEETKPLITPFSAAYSSPQASRGEAQGALALDAGLERVLRGALATVEARGALVRFRADGLRSATDTLGGGSKRLTSEVYATRALRAALRWRGGDHDVEISARLEQRAPTSGELLGDNLGIISRLDLRPEEARSLSLSHSWSGKRPGVRPALQSTVFWNEYRDPIRLKAHGLSSFMRYENEGDYRSAGLEVLAFASARLTEGSLSLTLQEAAILDGFHAGHQPAYLSPLETHAEFFVKPLNAPRAGARLGLLMDFRAAYFPGDANVPGSRRPAEWELGAHAGARFGQDGPVRLALEARNLTDRHYRDFAYSPRSGRSYSLSLSFNLQ